jgi:hypothetical protein
VCVALKIATRLAAKCPDWALFLLSEVRISEQVGFRFAGYPGCDRAHAVTAVQNEALFHFSAALLAGYGYWMHVRLSGMVAPRTPKIKQESERAIA